MTPEAVAAVLADFRQWLTDLPAPAGDAATPRPEETIDLHTLLGQFLAVRQEINLQTRAVRAQQEQNAETLRQLSAALDVLGRSQERATEDALRPLLTTLIELYDALTIAGRDIERMHEIVLDTPERFAAATDEAPPASCLATLRRSVFRTLLRSVAKQTRITEQRAALAQKTASACGRCSRRW